MALAHHRRVPGGVETEVRASAGDGLHLGNHIGIGSLDGVGGAQLQSQVEPVPVDVDGHDGGRAGDLSGHDRREPDGPGAEHHQAGPRPDVERDQDRSGTGEDPAAERAEQLEGKVGVDHHRVAGGGEAVGGQRRLGEPAGRHLRTGRISDRGGAIHLAAKEVPLEERVAIRRCT